MTRASSGWRLMHAVVKVDKTELKMLKFISPDFVFHTKFANHDKLKAHLFPEALRTCVEAPDDWNCDVLTSRKAKDIDYSSFLSSFQPIVTSLCDSIGTRGPVELRIESLWMNLYNKGSWQELHHHSTPINNLSFVYFLNYNPQTDGHFFFLNERSNHYSASGLHGVFKLSENLNIGEMNPFPVEEGDVIIFPSQLRHGVTMQRQSTNRCTLAGNLFVIPQLEKPAG